MAVQHVDWDAVDVLDARLVTLSTFCAPLGTPALEASRMPELRLVGAQIHFGRQHRGDGRPLVSSVPAGDSIRRSSP